MPISRKWFSLNKSYYYLQRNLISSSVIFHIQLKDRSHRPFSCIRRYIYRVHVYRVPGHFIVASSLFFSTSILIPHKKTFARFQHLFSCTSTSQKRMQTKVDMKSHFVVYSLKKKSVSLNKSTKYKSWT